jgi:hypothetical protein
MGIEDSYLFVGMVVRGLLGSFPSLLICIIACWMLLTNPRRFRAAPKPALWGFGLALSLGLVMPFLHAGMHLWMVSTAQTSGFGSAYALEFATLGLYGIGAILHATVFGLLLWAMITPKQTAPEPTTKESP